MALVTAIAQAVAATLNAAPRALPFTAELRYRPVFELRELATLKVSVVPRSTGRKRGSRAGDVRRVQVDVGVQRKVANDDEVTALLGLVEELADCFRVGQRLASYPDAVCTELVNEPVYAPEHLEQYRQFTSVLTLTFEVGP